MRDYGTVHTQFWIHPAYSKLSLTAKLIAVYLLTCPHTNMLGCFRLPEDYIAVDLSLDKSAVRSALDELTKTDFLSIDFQHGWILIHSFLEWNPIENPNQAKHIIKLFVKTPSQLSIHPKLIEILSTLPKQFDEDFKNHLQTLSEPFRNQEQEQKQEKNQKQKQEQEQEQEVSIEQDISVTVPDEVINIPLNSGGDYPITQIQIQQWEVLYPAVDIMQILRNIRGWNLANSKKRKTKSGILQHINTWLAKEQNNAGTQNNSHSKSQVRSYKSVSNLNEQNQRAAEQWLRDSEANVIDGEIVA